MRQPDENTVKPNELPEVSGKSLEDWQAGACLAPYPQGETFKEAGNTALSGAPPARASDDPLAHTKLEKKGLAPSRAADPPICHYDASYPDVDLDDATSDI